MLLTLERPQQAGANVAVNPRSVFCALCDFLRPFQLRILG